MTTPSTPAIRQNPFLHRSREAVNAVGRGNGAAANIAATTETFAAAVARLRNSQASQANHANPANPGQTSQANQTSQAAPTRAAPPARFTVLSQTRSLLSQIQQAQAGGELITLGTTTGGAVTPTESTGNTAGGTAAGPTAIVFPQLPQPSSAPIQTGDLPWLKAPSYLVAATALTENRQAVAEKPSLKEFIDKTGADATAASNVLYGVIGSNLDLRDWNAIMAAADPLASARASTAAQYNVATPATAPDNSQILARSGNFAVFKDTSNKTGGQLYLVDQQGNPLRQLPDDPAVILTAARDFGFDVRDLAGIAPQLQARSANGPNKVDYAALADGALGTQYDWRKDALASMKGSYGVKNLAANQAIAAEYGYI